MTNKGQFSICAGHAIAVVRHANKHNAPAFDVYAYTTRVGIKRVLDEFFHDARGSFDDFTCRDLICQIVR
jgi:hypothetical protein